MVVQEDTLAARKASVCGGEGSWVEDSTSFAQAASAVAAAGAECAYAVVAVAVVVVAVVVVAVVAAAVVVVVVAAAAGLFSKVVEVAVEGHSFLGLAS